MPKKPSADILRYLIRLDGFLTQPMKLVVIGGFAIALGWNDQHSTSDIDVIGQLDPELLRAMREAGPEEGAPPGQTRESPPGSLRSRPDWPRPQDSSKRRRPSLIGRKASAFSVPT